MTETLNKVYEQTELSEHQKQLKEVDPNLWKALSKKILEMEKKLSEFAQAINLDAKKTEEFLVRNMNDYLKHKYGCELKLSNKWLVLVFVDKNFIKFGILMYVRT